jgi:hypothetical protein
VKKNSFPLTVRDEIRNTTESTPKTPSKVTQLKKWKPPIWPSRKQCPVRISAQSSEKPTQHDEARYQIIIASQKVDD